MPNQQQDPATLNRLAAAINGCFNAGRRAPVDRRVMGELPSIIRGSRVAMRGRIRELDQAHWRFEAQNRYSRNDSSLADMVGTIETMKTSFMADCEALSGRLSALFATQPPDASLDNWLSEINGINAEYDFGFEISASLTKVWIETEPITLEEVELGRFRITLSFQTTGIRTQWPTSCAITALEPNPAHGTDDTVTHPHVSSSNLCFGEGNTPAHTALQEGRLLDYFTITDSVLHGYDPDGAYATLNGWEDGDYGDDEDDDEYIECCSCEGNAYVSDWSCGICNRIYCEDCSECQECPACGTFACLNCTKQCTGCEELFCNSHTFVNCKVCEVPLCGACSEQEPTREGVCPMCVDSGRQPGDKPSTTVNQPVPMGAA